MMKPNWFDTLADALESENILHLWDYTHICYGDTHRFIAEDGIIID